MKVVNIYVDGKGYNSKESAKWIYYLNYKDNVIKRTGNCENYPTTTVTLQALINALYCIKEPCYINIYSKVDLGFKNPKKSNNKLFIVEIQKMINEAGHIVKFIIDKEFKQTKIWDEQNKNKQVVQTKQEETQEEAKDWREMYSDLMGTTGSAWVPGSGGY